MSKNIWLVPTEPMYVEGRKVIKILCEPTPTDILKEKSRLQNMSKNRKRPIKCITNNKTYNSITAASKDTGIDAGAISRICNKKQKSSNGLTFEFQ